MNEFIEKVNQLVQDGVTQITSPESWVASAILRIQPKFSSDVYNFFSVRQNSPFYPREQSLNYSIIETEQEYLRLVYGIFNNDIDIQRLKQILITLDTLDGSAFKKFIISNLIEFFNVEDSEPSKNLEAKCVILNYLSETNKFEEIANFVFLESAQVQFSANSRVEQEKFLRALFKFPFELLIKNHENFLLFLIKSEWKELVKESFFEASKKDVGLIIYFKYFFLESGFIYPHEDYRDKTNALNFVYVYSKINSDLFLENWTGNTFEYVFKILECYEFPESITSKIMKLIKSFLIRHRENNLITKDIEVKILKLLKTYFDKNLIPKCSDAERFLISNLVHKEYFLFSNWSEDLVELDFLQEIDPSQPWLINLKKIFGIASPSFQKLVHKTFYNSNFFYINKNIFYLGILSTSFNDKNYLKSLYSHFFAFSDLASSSFYRFTKNLDLSSSGRKSLKETLLFFKTIYSEKRLYSLFLTEKDFFSAMDQMLDIKIAYDSLVVKVKNIKDQVRGKALLKLPKKIKSIAELHTLIYTRLSLLEVENIPLYDDLNPAWVIDGVQSIDQRLLFLLPKTSWDLKMFAMEMKNCIGGYVDKVLKRESILINIYSHKKPYASVEIKNSYINEIKGINNQLLAEEELALIKSILEQAQLLTN